MGKATKGATTINQAKSVELLSPCKDKNGTIAKNGNSGRRRRYSFFVSPIKSPQFLRILASSRDIVS